MNRCFIPFIGQEPLTLKVNGHDLILVSFDKEAFDGFETVNATKNSNTGLISKLDIVPVDLNNPALAFSARVKVNDDQIKVEQSDKEHQSSSYFSFGDLDVQGSEELLVIDEELSKDLNYDILPDAILGGDDGEPQEVLLDFGGENAVPSHLIRKLALCVAEKTKSGVVFIPPEVAIDKVLSELSQQLPWIH